ncbi:MAG: delta-60 repeat domain-containing protein [Elusimicrobiota bacterium]
MKTLCAALSLCLAAGGCALRGVRQRSFASPLDGRNAVGYGIRFDKSGRVVTAGIASDAHEIFRPAVWRFSRSGRLDRAFGKDGVSTLPVEGWAWSLAIDPRGRIIAAGFFGDSWQRAPAALVLRLIPDGSPDPSFGPGGIRSLRSPLGGESAAAYAVAVQEDGSVLAAGAASDKQGVTRAVVWRLRPDGEPDPGFGAGGAVVFRCPSGVKESRADAILLQGRSVVAAGNLDWERMSVWRLKADGSDDPEFGEAGRTLTPDGMGRGLLAAEDGGLWVAGFRYAGEGGETDREEMVLTRLDAAGRPGPEGALILRREGVRGGQESFAVAAGGGRMLLVGYSGAEDIVRAALWPFDLDGRQAGGVLELPSPEKGREDRAYAVAAAADGAAWVTGFSKDAGGKRSLALWRIPIARTFDRVRDRGRRP